MKPHVRLSVALGLIAAVACAPAAFAQYVEPAPETNIFGYPAGHIDEPMETDRPDFTEGTQTVPFGRFQIEAGYTYAFNDDDDVETSTHVFPEALLRVGLIDNVELRIGWDGYEWLEVDGPGIDEEENDFTDMELGFKIRSLEQDGFVPHLAFIPAFTIPVGGDSKSADQVDPSVIIAAAYDLPQGFSLGSNLGLAGVSNDVGDRFLETSVSVALGYSIHEYVGTYVEYYAIWPDDPDGEDEHVIDGGFTFPVSPNLQFDVRAGIGLSDAADDYFIGTGFAVRF